MDSNDNKKFDDILNRISTIISSVTSLVALVISFVTLTIYSNTYNLNKEQFLLNTTENLVISVGNSNSDIVGWESDKEDCEIFRKTELSICIVNKSNLPIYITDEIVYRSDYDNDIQISATIHDLELPILLQPQETKFLSCYLLIEIPDIIKEFIIEKFSNPSDVDFDTITRYLFFEKCTDLIGNEVTIEIEDDTTYFIQNLTLPFSLSFDTSKGNTFSTKFYEGGTEFTLTNEYRDQLYEQYGSFGIKFSKEPIQDDMHNNQITFWKFISDDPSSLLVIIIPTVIVAFPYISFLYILEKRKMKIKRINEQEMSDNSCEKDST